MRSGLERWYRILATGIGFVVFGGLTLVFSVLILLTPRARNSPPGTRRQWLATGFFRYFLHFLRWIGVFRNIDYRGVDRIPSGTPCVFIANHPTLLDPVVLLAATGPADCIVKDKHMRFFSQISRWFGYVPDRHSTELFEKCVKRVNAGRRLLMFPERTRSPEGGLRPFSRVPAQVSLAAGCPVVPILIEVNHHAFGKDQAWYEVPPDPLHMRVTFLEPHRPEREGRFSEASRRCTEAWRGFYEEQLPVESLE